MPSGLSQSHQEIAGQFQRELLQLICLGSGGQHVQRPLPRGMGRPIGLQCPCNSFTRQEVRGASDSTNQRIENNALVSSSGLTGGARRVVYLVVSYSPVRGSAKDTRLRIHLDRQAIMVQTADGSPEEGAGRKDDDMSNPMWVHIIRLLDDEEQAKKVLQIFKQAMSTRAIETDLSARDRAQHMARTSDMVAAELAGLDSLKGVTDLQRRQQLLLATRVVINNAVSAGQ